MEVEEKGLGRTKGRKQKRRGSATARLGGEQGIPSSPFPLDPSPSSSHLLAVVSPSPQPPPIRPSRPSSPDLRTSRMQVVRRLLATDRRSATPRGGDDSTTFGQSRSVGNGPRRSTGGLTRVRGGEGERTRVDAALQTSLCLLGPFPHDFTFASGLLGWYGGRAKRGCAGGGWSEWEGLRLFPFERISWPRGGGVARVVARRRECGSGSMRRIRTTAPRVLVRSCLILDRPLSRCRGRRPSETLPNVRLSFKIAVALNKGPVDDIWWMM